MKKKLRQKRVMMWMKMKIGKKQGNIILIIFIKLFCFRLSHKLHFKEDTPVLAKDANTKDDDWFEIYDPRNPLNKRRRGENSSKSKK